MPDRSTVTKARIARPRVKQVAGVIVPAAGLAAMAVSASALSALAAAFPESGALADFAGTCDPRSADFGCGHGFGCICHLWPAEGSGLD